ncbi:hypothetical protein VTN02DRAFT_6131 [Thermoascus thermophilus]
MEETEPNVVQTIWRRNRSRTTCTRAPGPGGTDGVSGPGVSIRDRPSQPSGHEPERLLTQRRRAGLDDRRAHHLSSPFPPSSTISSYQTSFSCRPPRHTTPPSSQAPPRARFHREPARRRPLLCPSTSLLSFSSLSFSPPFPLSLLPPLPQRVFS